MGGTGGAHRGAKMVLVNLRLLSSTSGLLCFLALVSTALLPAQSTKTDDAMAGAILFRDKGCAHCHGANGEGTQKAPSLVNIRTNKVWTVAKMTDQILNGGEKMPPFADSLSDPEIAQIVTYLRAKKRPVPPPAPASN